MTAGTSDLQTVLDEDMDGDEGASQMAGDEEVDDGEASEDGDEEGENNEESGEDEAGEEDDDEDGGEDEEEEYEEDDNDSNGEAAQSRSDELDGIVEDGNTHEHQSASGRADVEVRGDEVTEEELVDREPEKANDVAKRAGSGLENDDVDAVSDFVVRFLWHMCFLSLNPKLIDGLLE